jgi:predicted glycoside hydrolase/deacetylase ChbG (UPF0249 family)
VPAGRLVIVNADDLGLHEDINRGIELAHTRGVVTSSSVVACGSAFLHASKIIESCPELDVGVHLTLTEERPLSPPAEVPTLVGGDGLFLRSYRELAARILTGALSAAELRREFERQIERVIALGRRPSHLDGHDHAHLFPPVWRVTSELARDYGIRWIRLPRFGSLLASRRSAIEPVFRLGLNVLSATAARSRNAPKVRPETPGLHLSGALTETDLANVVERIRPGITEIVTHPAISTPALQARYRWNYEWSTELAALTSPRTIALLRSNGVRLTRFADC